MSLQEKTIKCFDCGSEFVFSVEETRSLHGQRLYQFPQTLPHLP